jgi:desampylase
MRAEGSREGKGLRVEGRIETIAINAVVIDDVVAHARAAQPNECCGILVGSAGRVDEAWRARNIAERPATRFLIDPADHLTALKDARRRGLDVVGFYHSHPRSSAEPSSTDLAEASYPDHLFLIVGGDAGRSAAGEVRLYRFADGNFRLTSFVRVP